MMGPQTGSVLLGYDVRLHPSTNKVFRPSERRLVFLLREDAEVPLSVDTADWLSLFDDGSPWYFFPGRPEPVPRPEWTGPNGGLWDNLPQMLEYAASHLEKTQPSPWVIAVTLQRDQDTVVVSEQPPYIESMNPQEIDSAWVVLGFDVADRFLLSVLANMGTGVDEKIVCRNRRGPFLNDHHLFRDPVDAFSFARNMDSAILDHSPCFVYGIWHVPT
jgi:hypothetical protein